MSTFAGNGASLLLAVLLSTLFCVVYSGSAFTSSDLKNSESFFTLTEDGSFGSVEETYHGVSVLKVTGGLLGSEKICSWLSSVGSSDPTALSYKVKTAALLNCEILPSISKGAETVFLSTASTSKDLLPLYFAITGLNVIKEKGLLSNEAVLKEPLKEALVSLKALTKPDGTWRYLSSSHKGSAKAAGMGLEAAAFLIKSGIVQGTAQVISFQSAVEKLFDSGSSEEAPFILREGPGDETSGGSSITATLAAAVKGAIAIATAVGEPTNVASLLLEATNLLLEASPTSSWEAFYQLDALSALNDNSVGVPLLVNMKPQISLAGSSELEVTVATVLGGTPSSVKVDLARGESQGPTSFTKSEDGTFKLPFPGKKVLGKFAFSLEVSGGEPKYLVPDTVMVTTRVTGAIAVRDAKLTVADSGSKTPETEEKLTFGGSSAVPEVSATHLQNLELSFKLVQPSGSAFSPQQVLVKLTHESGVVHQFVPVGKDGIYSLKLNFLEMLDKLYYLSGDYTIEVTVGDSVIENSFVWKVAQLELSLPEAPDSAPKPPSPPPSLSQRFGPKPEILHIFRVPEKQPPVAISYLFTALALLPFFGLLIGFGSLGVNVDLFPTAGLPLVSAIAFHGALGTILALYFVFWLKMNIFFTLKALVVLGLLTTLPGHYLLSYLSSVSSKVKTA